jgi:hypothetical protein
LWLCIDTSTASEDVTQPEHARQSVSDICAAVLASGGVVASPSIPTASSEEVGAEGRVSTGLMQVTDGAMKSFNVSAERMADIVVVVEEGDGGGKFGFDMW